MDSTKKINIASLRVLNTLLCLFEQDLSMKELIEQLNKKGYGPYNNFVVSKYINTCKSCGIDIQKINNKYKLINFPVGDVFMPNEGELLFMLKAFSETFKTKKVHEIIEGLLKKLHLNLYKTNNGMLSSENYRIIKLFEKACLSNSSVDVVFDNKTMENYNPEDIYVKDGKIFFRMSQDDDIVDFDPDNILDIQLLEEGPNKPFFVKSVIFELRGRLAKSYQLRENEQMLHQKGDDVIVVSNKYEDKETLLHRLMRYDSSCKIIKPQEYVDDMKKMIEKSLQNYGE